jgi:hypothetical protein
MRKVLLLIALFSASCVFAQTDGDTTVVRSDLYVDTVSAPAEEGTGVIDSEEEVEKKNYLAPLTAADKSPVQLRPVPSRRLDSLRRQDDFWYWKARPEKEKQEKGGSWLAALFSSGIMRLLFWLLIAVGCAALIYFFLLSLNVNLFGKRKDGVEEEVAADPEANFFSRDYDREIAQALAAGEYRIAIRLRYLQLLKELADRNIIQYRQERPNGVYVSQLMGTPYYKEFFRVTRTFEYAWYGEMPVGRSAYDFMQNDIDQLKARFA